MLESSDAAFRGREAALMEQLRLARQLFAANDFSKPETLFEALSRQSEAYDPVTMPGVRWIVDQVQEAIKRHQPSTMHSSGNDLQAIF
jgi:hypothetical protein